MPFGDGIRRNIAHVDPSERALLRDAFVELNKRFFAGTRTDTPPGGVTWWFKQDEIHQATHVHGGPEFLPWHREIVNRLEAMLRQINPKLSLHYWDWTQDPTNIPNANLGGGTTGNLNLFTTSFMGYGGSSSAPIGEPWLSAGYYVPGAANYRSTNPFDSVNNNPADPPREVVRFVSGSPRTAAQDNNILIQSDYFDMRSELEIAHNAMHGFVNMGGQHTSFRDPFVFLLHSNVDRLFARWQTDPAHPERLAAATLYGPESGDIGLNSNVEPWSGGGGTTRPWAPPENQQVPHNYKAASLIAPPCYDTNHDNFFVLEAENPFNAATNRYQVIFNEVPEEETTWRAAVIRVFTCGDVTIKVKPGTEPAAPFLVSTPSVPVPHGPNAYVDVRIWFQFTAGVVGTAPQTLPAVNTTIRCEENGQEFPFELIANTIKRRTVAVQLALDQSGSMAWDAGTSGATRLQVLVDAANLFANLIQKNNGIGIIRFDDDAYPPNDPTYGGMSITKVLADGFGDPTRTTALGVIAAHGAHGNTSVGDGLDMARVQLAALPSGSYEEKAIVLLTDGLENTPKMIAEVGPIDNKTFAVGLGNEMQVDTAALTALAGSTGGYLLLSGLLGPSLDDQFRLRKFFLQILAGLTNTSIVKDPVGYINVGTKIKIPFQLCEADINCRVILLTDFPVVTLSIEAPDGKIINEANAASFGTTFDTTTNIKTARFPLPVAFQADKLHAGTWHAILAIDDAVYEKFVTGLPTVAANPAIGGLKSKGAKYCLSVHSFSNLRMDASISQTGFTPGSTLSLRTRLVEYGLPVEKRAAVTAELEYPDHTKGMLTLAETQPGVFETAMAASAAGIYRFKVLAEGTTYRGAAFTREQLMTAAVFHQVPGHGVPDEGGGIVGILERCCRRMGAFVGVIIALLLVIIWLLMRG